MAFFMLGTALGGRCKKSAGGEGSRTEGRRQQEQYTSCQWGLALCNGLQLLEPGAAIVSGGGQAPLRAEKQQQRAQQQQQRVQQGCCQSPTRDAQAVCVHEIVVVRIAGLWDPAKRQPAGDCKEPGKRNQWDPAHSSQLAERNKFKKGQSLGCAGQRMRSPCCAGQ